MKKYYTYLIRCIPENRVYYGVRYSEKIKPGELWTTYFTSSIYVKKLIKKYGEDAFIFEIRRTFDTPKKATDWEKKVLRRMKADVNPKFINKHIPGEGFTCSLVGDENPMRKPENVMKNQDTFFDKYGVLNPGQLDHVRQKSAETISKMNSMIVECPHCSQKGGYINMLRYHFNNCKHKPCPKGGVLRFIENLNDAA